MQQKQGGQPRSQAPLLRNTKLNLCMRREPDTHALECRKARGVRCKMHKLDNYPCSTHHLWCVCCTSSDMFSVLESLSCQFLSHVVSIAFQEQETSNTVSNQSIFCVTLPGFYFVSIGCSNSEIITCKIQLLCLCDILLLRLRNKSGESLLHSFSTLCRNSSKKWGDRRSLHGGRMLLQYIHPNLNFSSQPSHDFIAYEECMCRWMNMIQGRGQ